MTLPLPLHPTFDASQTTHWNSIQPPRMGVLPPDRWFPFLQTYTPTSWKPKSGILINLLTEWKPNFLKPGPDKVAEFNSKRRAVLISLVDSFLNIPWRVSNSQENPIICQAPVMNYYTKMIKPYNNPEPCTAQSTSHAPLNSDHWTQIFVNNSK